MATATVPIKLLVTVSLIVVLLLGLAIGYVVSDVTRADMPMQMMSGMDMGDMDDMGDMADMRDHMDDMSAHMKQMGMDMDSMMGSGSKRDAADMPPMHGHD